MNPTFFKTALDFRKWLAKNHDKKTELLVGYYKVKSDKPSMTWPESVDQAICYGWIDGIRRSIDQDSYSIRFTPRRPTSIWSAVNINKAEELIKNGQMQPSGLASYKLRKESRSKVYAYEAKHTKLSKEYEDRFKENTKAWNFFTEQAPWYKKKVIHYIMTAKQEKTRLRRLEKIITESEQQERLN